jgi:small-conductance mechanosensitive channel
MSSATASACPVCGGSIVPNAVECPHCGERLSDRALSADEGTLRQELEELHASRKKNNTLGFLFGVPGLLLQVGGGVVAEFLDMPGFGLIGRLIGLILLAIGLYFVSKYKGRNGAWALLALIGCIGLIVLLVLKDYNLQRIKQIEAALGTRTT